MTPQDAAGGPLARLGGQLLMGRAQADGTFSIAACRPDATSRSRGRAAAAAGRSGDLRVGTQPVVVNGQNIEGVTLALQPGITLSGNITVESSGTPAPADYSVFRIDVPEVNPLPFGGGGGRGGGGPLGGGGRVREERTFTVPNLLPGPHYIRVDAAAACRAPGRQSWTVKSVTVGGQDVSDAPIDIKPGQNVENVSVVLTDRTDRIVGNRARRQERRRSPALTVIVFSAERAGLAAAVTAHQCRAHGSVRRVPLPQSAAGRLPDGRRGRRRTGRMVRSRRTSRRSAQDATRLSISEGEKKTQDLRGPST